MPMPEVGTQEYADLEQETGGASTNPGFNYEAHVAATSGSAPPPPLPPVLSNHPDQDNIQNTDQDAIQTSPPIYLVDPPAQMPEPGTPDYDLLVLEIGFIPGPGFNYESHIQATRGQEIDSLVDKPPIYLLNPPKDMPVPGTADYELLVLEIGFIPGPGFNYESHIQATRGQEIDSLVDKPPIYLLNPPARMPLPGTEQYHLLFLETGGASDIPGFNYEAHIQATRGQSVSEIVVSSIERLYTAAFGRVPDEGGIQFWVNAVNDPLVSYKNISQNFIDSPEFSIIASPNSSNDVFASALYQNVLGREPDSQGLSYWTNELNSGLQDRSDVLMGFANSSENVVL